MNRADARRWGTRLVAVAAGVLSPVLAFAGGPSWAEVASADGWKLDSDNATDDAGDVQVFTRSLYDVPCYRALALAKGVNTRVMLDVTEDVKAATSYSTQGLSASTLLGVVNGWVDFDQYLDVPDWTFASDRFWFLRAREELVGAATGIFHWEKLDEGGPHHDAWLALKAEHPDAVEPPVNVGGWTFTMGSAGVNVEYRICTASGGSVPAAIQSAATRHTLPATVSDVVHEARRRLGS